MPSRLDVSTICIGAVRLALTIVGECSGVTDACIKTWFDDPHPNTQQPHPLAPTLDAIFEARIDVLRACYHHADTAAALDVRPYCSYFLHPARLLIYLSNSSHCRA